MLGPTPYGVHNSRIHSPQIEREMSNHTEKRWILYTHLDMNFYPVSELIHLVHGSVSMSSLFS